MNFKVKLPTVESEQPIYLETQSYNGMDRRITLIAGEREIELLEVDLKALSNINIELEAEIDVMGDNNNTYVRDRMKATITKNHDDCEYGYIFMIEISYDDIKFKVKKNDLKEIIEGL